MADGADGTPALAGRLGRAGLQGRLDRGLFLTGLALRIALILTITPPVQEALFMPFFDAFLAAPSLDPWRAWLDAGRSAQAFPYGVVMFVLHLPFVLVGHGIDLVAGLDGRGMQLGFAGSLLAMDLLLLRTLRRWIGEMRTVERGFESYLAPPAQPAVARYLLIFYWLSPLVLYVTYVHGQVDILPTLLLTIALRALSAGNAGLAGMALIAAIFAKASVIVMLPFLAFYVATAPLGGRFLKDWSFVVVAFTGIFLGITALAPGQIAMVASNTELAETLRFGFTLPTGLTVLVFPLILFVGLATMMFLAPIDRSGLFKLMGAVIIGLVAVSSASIGWYLWALPFVVAAAIGFSPRLRAVIMAFWGLAVALDVLTRYPELAALAETGAVPILSGIQTLVFGLGLLIATRLIWHLTSSALSYRIVNRPIFVGIAGDSGSGKDTLTLALAALVGPGRASILLGDDYHAYARDAKMWRALTHLDPRANHLSRLFTDIRALAARKPIYMHHYDHATGTFTPPRRIRPRSLTIVNGLHALYAPSARAAYDLKVFLSMDEGLRRALKIRRDTTERGKSLEATLAAIDARVADGEAHIAPQADKADILFSLCPVAEMTPDALARLVAESPDLNRDHRLCLRVTTRGDIDLDALRNAFQAFAGVAVTTHEAGPDGRLHLDVHGDALTPEEVRILMERLLGPMAEFFCTQPEYHFGQQGAMQVISYAVLEQILALDATAPPGDLQ